MSEIARVGEPLPEALLSHSISGLHLQGATLGEQIGRGPTLLTFLRHSGCIFCRETIADIRRARDEEPGFADVVFLTQSLAEHAARIFSGLWPGVPVICDAEPVLSRGFGLRRGGLGQLLGPSVWAAGIRALSKGHFVGRPVGDLRLLPGLFLVVNQVVVWEHHFRNSGDQPRLRGRAFDSLACTPSQADEGRSSRPAKPR